MNESASEGGALAARKKRTTVALIREARRLTALVGLGGFTVDEVCEAVGISRRTFFNYFSSKDDAVIGIPLGSPVPGGAEEFFASAERGVSLPDAMVTLILATFGDLETPELGPGMVIETVFETPQLLRRVQVHIDERVAEVADLIVTREGLPAGDPGAKLASMVFSNVAMHTMHTLETEHDDGPGSPSAPPAPEQLSVEFATRLRENYARLGTFFSPAPSTGGAATRTVKDTHE